jgi:hypothetical protein
VTVTVTVPPPPPDPFVACAFEPPPPAELIVAGDELSDPESLLSLFFWTAGRITLRTSTIVRTIYSARYPLVSVESQASAE